jgi:ATP-dependent DNA ligase
MMWSADNAFGSDLNLWPRLNFLEWTESDHLRHSKFAGLREDKDPKTVVKEHVGEA